MNDGGEVGIEARGDLLGKVVGEAVIKLSQYNKRIWKEDIEK